ncbi:putative immunity protein [Hymenobacter sp. HD11105]
MKAETITKLDLASHQALAQWATACAEHVLHHFETERPQDERPRQALEACRAWARGELPMTQVRIFAFGAHAAACEAQIPAARAAARAAGQAAGTAHVPGHARHAATYAVKAAAEAVQLSSAKKDMAAQLREWQRQQLPELLQSLSVSLLSRAKWEL